MKMSKYLGWIVVLSVAGCQQLHFPDLDVGSLNPRSQSPDEDEIDDEFKTQVDTPMIGEYTAVTGLNLITLQGVGLVVGLNGTGGDPPPSVYRSALLEDMRKRGVTNPNQILRQPDTALVVVRAYLPPLIRKGDRFDVEVRLPENSSATSLNGGRLLTADLTEQAIIPGHGVIEGHVYARAKGPILISTGEGDESSLAGVLRRGRIVGGGISLKDRNLSLFLREDFRTVRNSKRIADRIGQRFFDYNEYGIREPLAEAKTDKQIELKVHDRYTDNYPRYLAVLRSMAFQETDVAERVRLRRLQNELNDPAKAQQAAIQLEAIGLDAVPTLKSGLKNESLEVRFHSAMALAYLGDSDGLDALAEAARQEPAFRVYAFASMAALDDVESHMALRNLMNERSAETRYGAFRALTTLDKNDPFIRGEKLNDEFSLHVLETDGPPMVHLTKRRQAEIVLFGAEQRFRTPIAVRAGHHVLVTAPAGSGTITISRYEPGAPDRQQIVSTRVADVIRTAAEFGATYPDIAQMLAQAEKQYNLDGRIEIDALPRAGRVYYRPAEGQSTSSKSKVRVGNSGWVPNLFDGAEGKDLHEDPEDSPNESSAENEKGHDESGSSRSDSGKESQAKRDEPAGGVKHADSDEEAPETKRKRFDLLGFFRRMKSDADR